ncbi:hypothetical protein CALVIDRAFT_235777 [Calocera viscosa TUFC12733]|uniref:Uncharacterized protein n=1 Tax=Calocera viscosa (strain TUFC12733) TaxID=1330018 RepID=A0A167JTD3_CALVF|nr:hypothetical protein CALVIDRAFT_235777 [Calocera viscosa TUFC12733]
MTPATKPGDPARRSLIHLAPFTSTSIVVPSPRYPMSTRNAEEEGERTVERGNPYTSLAVHGTLAHPHHLPSRAPIPRRDIIHERIQRVLRIQNHRSLPLRHSRKQLRPKCSVHLLPEDVLEPWPPQPGAGEAKDRLWGLVQERSAQVGAQVGKVGVDGRGRGEGRPAGEEGEQPQDESAAFGPACLSAPVP